jgi:hypothetical protein
MGRGRRTLLIGREAAGRDAEWQLRQFFGCHAGYFARVFSETAKLFPQLWHS